MSKQHRPRSISVLALALLCGCGAPLAAVDDSTPTSKHAFVQPAKSAFRFDQAKQLIFIDSRVAPMEKRRFDLGQGSITLETLHVKEGRLTFRYTPETEGGYMIYECSVPVSDKPVEFKIERGGVPGATSFDLKGCKVIGRGNLLDK